jgi:uncharacterized protein
MSELLMWASLNGPADPVAAVQESVWVPVLLASGAALLIGFSKTGLPGAGMPAIALMAAAFREETRLSVGAMVPLLILGDVIAVIYYRRHANWQRLLELLPYIALGMVPGYWVLLTAQSQGLRTLIGVIILLLLGLHFSQQRLGWAWVPDRWWFTALMGLLAGFGTIVGNAAGPAMGIYLVSRKLNKHEFIGTSAWLFLVVNSSKVPFQLPLGIITWDTLRIDLYAAPALIAGALLGLMVHGWIPQRLFNSLILALAALAALHMVWF